MTYFAKVQNGTVVLPANAQLPDGTTVEVRPIEEASLDTADGLTDALLKIASRTKDLPTDLAERHDHYLHGHPKA